MFAEISGFLFLFIIVVLVTASSRYGYEIFSELDSEAQLQKIHQDSQRFRTGTLLVVLEHVAIVSLAVTMFIAFGPYNMVLGVIWVVARGTEGLIQIYRKNDYWRLLALARQYSGTSGAERDALGDSAITILKSKNSTFTIAQILFSIGTLSYSILFVFYAVIPVVIGWFGIGSSIIYGLGNAATRVRPNFKVMWNLGGLLIWVFELVLGGWLLFSSFIVP